MAALHSFGSVPIFVREDEPSAEPYDAILKILDSGTNVIQALGGGSPMRHIVGLVIGDANRLQLESDARTNTARTYTNDQGSQGSYKITGKVTAKRRMAAGADLDGVAYGADTPLYDVEMDIISTA